MKCNTLYEDQCCTSCFKREGTKITECPSYIVSDSKLFLSSIFTFSTSSPEPLDGF